VSPSGVLSVPLPRWVRRALILVLLLATLAVLLPWGASELGQWLVVADPLEPARAIVVACAMAVRRGFYEPYARFLASQGVDIDKAELDWNKIADDFKPEAVKRVKRSLILEAIARKEKIVVSDVEVDAEIRRASNESGRDFAEVKHRLVHDGGYEALRASLAQEKALDFVLKEAHAR